MHTNYNFCIEADVSTLYNYHSYKMYGLPCVVDVDALRAFEGVGDSAVFVDSVPVVVVDNVALEVEIPPRRVVSRAEKRLKT